MTATFDISRGESATSTSHLAPGQLARLRALLVDERDGLSRQLAEHTSVLAELGEDGSDVEGVERELVGLHAARAREVVEEIDGALSRLTEASYGLCEFCGRSIPFERLEVIPRARFCVACPPLSARRR